jgi:hypothetical protein
VTDYAGSSGAQIQAAIRDNGAAAVPGMVWIPTGTWYVTGSIVIDCDDLIVQGCGPHTVLRAAGSLDANPIFMVNVGSDRVLFQHMWLQGKDSTEYGVQVSSGGFPTVHNIDFEQMRFGGTGSATWRLNRGIYFHSHHIKSSVNDCQFNDCDSGIYFRNDAHEIDIVGSQFEDNNYGIQSRCTAGGTENVEGIRISASYFMSQATAHIGGNRMIWTSISDTHFGSISAAGGAAIGFTGRCDGLKIANCDFLPLEKVVRCINLPCEVLEFQMTNCELRGLTGSLSDGMIFIDPNTPGENGRTIRVTNTRIALHEGARGIAINGINFEDVVLDGINVGPISGTAADLVRIINSDNVSVVNSLLEYGNYGLVIEDCDEVVVEGNKLLNNQAAGAWFWANNDDMENIIVSKNIALNNGSYGILVSDDPGLEIDYLLVTENIARGNTTDDISISIDGAHTVVANNMTAV